MRSLHVLPLALLTLLLGACGPAFPVHVPAERPVADTSTSTIQRVVHISVDGLRPDAIARWEDQLPAYARLRTEGAYTDNARTTPTRGNTIPNHTSQLTGRVVAGADGHGWGANRDTDPTATLHANKGSYVSSVFDVVDDAGLRGALFASKEKFALFERSYGDVLDAYVYDSDTDDLTARFVDSLRTGSYAYAFLHLRSPDTVGHRFGWLLRTWHPYGRAVRATDRQIGLILTAIDTDPQFRGTTAVILTADHGGHGFSHGADDARDYTVPLYVWGPGIPPGSLYALLDGQRADPGSAQIPADTAPQPVRNGDAANLSLSLLGLNRIPGSTLGPLDLKAPLTPGVTPASSEESLR